MNNRTLAKIAFSALALTPMLALAAAGTSVETILGVIKSLMGVIIPLLMILATVIFLWGVITYITAGGDEEKAATGRAYIIWGLIGLFAMIAVWGLVQALATTFGVGGETIPKGPTIQ